MADINSILQAYALQEADKQRIAQSSPYLGAQSAATGINDFILKSSANPEYSTSEKIIAGLLGGLVSGGIESYNDDWQSRAEKEFISASQGGRQSVFDTLAGKPATPVKRDLLPRSVFDVAERKGQESGLISVFDTIDQQRNLKIGLQEKALEQVFEDRPDMALSIAAGDFSALNKPQQRTIAQTPEEAMVSQQIATRVPRDYRKDAIKEAGEIKQLQEIFSTVDAAIDTAANNTTTAQRADDILPFGKLPNWSDESRARETAKAQIVSVITPIWKGPLGDTDIALIIDPFVPKDGDSQQIIEQKRQGLHDLIKNNSGGTPTLDQFGVGINASNATQPITPSQPTSDLQQAARQFATEAKRLGLSETEARRRWEQFRSGVPPTSSSGSLRG